jgi:hypothetical protein
MSKGWLTIGAAWMFLMSVGACFMGTDTDVAIFITGANVLGFLALAQKK